MLIRDEALPHLHEYPLHPVTSSGTVASASPVPHDLDFSSPANLPVALTRCKLEQ